jgi:murein L,D-transpeptidase YafK
MGFLAPHRDFYITPGLRLGIIVGLLLVLYFQVPGIALEQPTAFGSNDERLVPDSLLRFPSQKHRYALLVEKSSQRAFLYETCAVDHPIKVYSCSTGKNRGPKCELNDKKTPEGIYFVTDSFEKRDLPAIYGDRAFPLDYPNQRDRKMGRKGHGIWIHGTNERLAPHDTSGCIVFRNEDIRELSAYMSEGFTPIIITKTINFIEKAELQKDRKRLEQLIVAWLEAWRQGRIDFYMSLYSQDFTAQGKTREQWRAYKKRLSALYDEIDITADNLIIARENGIVLAKFDQVYKNSRFLSIGEKRLYLQKKNPEWKIADEFFKKRREVIRALSSSPRNEEVLAAITRLLASWRRAWQDKDLTAYMAHYADDFFCRGMDRAAWERYKARVNGGTTAITVTIKNAQIRLPSPSRATVSFEQDYRSDTYHDRGHKTLELVKQGGTWKIRREIWRP